MMNKKPVAVLILTLCGAVAFGQPRYVIQSGHTGSISSLQFQESSHSLITAGVDGVVKVWNVEKLNALDSASIAPRNIQLLSVHPHRSVYAAVFAEEGEYTLVVRDWSRQEELYRLSFSQKPLLVSFSPRGTYLAVCLENWRSLHLYEADDGRPLDAFGDGFGIVSFIAFSTKETTVMTYQPSGKISYWETATGKKVSELRAQGGLLPVTLAGNKVHLLCAARNGIVFLDVVSGKTVQRLDIPGLVLSAGDVRGDRLALFSNRRGERETVGLYAIENGRLKDIFSNTLPETSSFSALLATENSVFAGNARGEVYLIFRNNAVKVIQNNLQAVSDLALNDETLALGAARSLFVFKSGFFNGGQEPDAAETALTYRTYSNPYGDVPVGMLFDQQQAGLIIWKKSGVPGALSLLDPVSFRVARHINPFPADPVKCVAAGDRLVTVTREGSCSVIDTTAGNTLFQPMAKGINAAVFISPTRLICGKSRLTSYESSLAVIKSDTGETTFLPETADIVYELAYNQTRETLYYIGVEKQGGRIATVVKSRSGKDLKDSRTLFSKPGRFFNSVLAGGQTDGRLYFSLEENVVYVWDGEQLGTIESSTRPVKKLYAYPRVLYALNADNSITAWSRANGMILFSLYLFKNMSWLMVTRDGRYLSQGDVASFVKVYEGGPEPRGLPEQYQLKVTGVMNAKDSP